MSANFQEAFPKPHDCLDSISVQVPVHLTLPCLVARLGTTVTNARFLGRINWREHHYMRTPVLLSRRHFIE